MILMQGEIHLGTPRRKRFMMTVAVYLVYIRDGKVLLLRRANTGYADGMYSMIAGHMDGNETIQQAMSRESLEEGRIKIEEQDIDIVHVMHRRAEDGERIDYFCTARKMEGEPLIGEPEKCDDLSWFPIDDVPQNTLPYIKIALEQIGRNSIFSSVGF
jgi:8-oxo-dGTP diphosphatase